MTRLSFYLERDEPAPLQQTGEEQSEPSSSQIMFQPAKDEEVGEGEKVEETVIDSELGSVSSN